MISTAEAISAAAGQRAVVTVVLLTIVSVTATFAVPRVGGLVAGYVNTVLDEWNVREPITDFWNHTPPGVSFRAIISTTQIMLFVFTGLFLLGLWGWADVIYEAADLLFTSLPNLPQIGLTALMLALMYSGARYVGDWVGGLREDADYIHDHTMEILTRSLQVMLLLGGTLTILSIWKVNVSNFLLGAGVMSVLIGFAARSTFSSAVSGFVLMFSRPFEVGDWIEISDTEGQVTDVTIVNTRLRTPEGERVILPNDTIADSEIINYSHDSKLCIPLYVGVAYDTDLDTAAETIGDALRDVDPLSSGSAIEVYPKEFADSSILLETRVWIDHAHPLTRRRARAEAVERIQEAFEREGIEIPYPKQDVHARLPDRFPPDTVSSEPGSDHGR